MRNIRVRLNRAVRRPGESPFVFICQDLLTDPFRIAQSYESLEATARCRAHGRLESSSGFSTHSTDRPDGLRLPRADTSEELNGTPNAPVRASTLGKAGRFAYLCARPIRYSPIRDFARFTELKWKNPITRLITCSPRPRPSFGRRRPFYISVANLASVRLWKRPRVRS
jgi:hypothetical protein